MKKRKKKSNSFLAILIVFFEKQLETLIELKNMTKNIKKHCYQITFQLKSLLPCPKLLSSMNNLTLMKSLALYSIIIKKQLHTLFKPQLKCIQCNNESALRKKTCCNCYNIVCSTCFQICKKTTNFTCINCN